MAGQRSEKPGPVSRQLYASKFPLDNGRGAPRARKVKRPTGRLVKFSAEIIIASDMAVALIREGHSVIPIDETTPLSFAIAVEVA